MRNTNFGLVNSMQATEKPGYPMHTGTSDWLANFASSGNSSNQHFVALPFVVRVFRFSGYFDCCSFNLIEILPEDPPFGGHGRGKGW